MSDPASLLPKNATEQEKTMEMVASVRLEAIPVPLRDLFNPALIQADLLPWLAWALNTLEWRSDFTEQQQRDAIAISIDVHNELGTRASLRRGLDSIGLTNANIIELVPKFYDGSENYDGNIDHSNGPYLFDIELTDQSNNYSVSDIKRAIETFSNVRSHLRNLFLSQLRYDGTFNYDGSKNYDGGYVIG